MVESMEVQRLGSPSAGTLCSPAAVARSLPAGVAVALWGAALCAASQVRIPVPLSPVPMTLQLLVVLLAGFALSPGRAAAATVLYLACGLAGLPVFAGRGGLLGETGGYLLGFVAAAWLVGWTKGDGRGIVRLALAGVAGTMVVFVSGVLWLSAFYGGDVVLAVTSGAAPFVVKGSIEIALAVAVARGWNAFRAGRTAIGDGPAGS